MASNKPNGRIAIVTGANRGIGLEVVRQLADRGFTVFLGSRDHKKGESAAKGIPGDVRVIELDVASHSSVNRALEEVKRQVDHLDVLINNAAINYDTWQTAANADLDRVVPETIETNLMGAWRMVQAFLPLLKKSTQPRIVNVSSEAGSLARMGAGPPAYQVTKAALNALTLTVAGELKKDGILVNAVCPGWTATDMGGGGRPIAEGAASVVWAAVLEDDGPTGGFFRDGKALKF